MITYLTVFNAKDSGSSEALELIFSKLRKITPSEQGCIHYEIYSNDDNPLVSYIIETWDTQESFERHVKVVSDNRYVEQALLFTAEPFESIRLITKFTSTK